MKVYVYEKGFVMVGKAREICSKLKEYQEKYQLVGDWIYSSGPGQ